MNKKKEKLLIKIGDFIVKFRYVFLVLFLGLGLFSLFQLDKVSINYEITSYLPDNTETKKGLQIMEEEFGNLNGLELMIKNISLNEAEQVAIELNNISNITSVSFENNENFYKNDIAFYIISLDDVSDSEKEDIKEDIISVVADQEYYLYDEFNDDVVGGMNIILCLAIVVIIIVLILTSKSYFDIVLAFMVFGLSILINMGTNYLFGEISYITESIAIILQLGLSLDYLIIFLNHYHKEIKDTSDNILAVKKTVSKSIPEIFASSLTTIAGLLALVFMQLKIGADIGLVLSKGIICSLFTVILVMPALLIIFSKIINKLNHKSFIPNTLKISKFIVAKKKIILPIFLVILLVSICLIPKYNYVYNINSVVASNTNENMKAKLEIDEEFGNNNRLVLLIYNVDKNYNKELLLAQNLLLNKNVINVSTTGNIKVGENVYLGTELSAQDFQLLTGMDKNVIKQLYKYYAMVNKIDSSDIKISLIDLINFLHNENLNLSKENLNKINVYYNEILAKLSLLETDNYSRIVVDVKTDIESDEAFDTAENIRDIAKDYYDDVIMVGDTINAKDLKDSFTTDNIIITLLTVFFILIILLFTFKSIGLSIILILAIEGSILINFGMATLFDKPIFFISYIIVSAIQMGATIDYAIIVSNRYLGLRAKMDKKEALIGTLRDTISAVITSGFILITAGLLIGFISDSGVVASIGLFLGIGTFISLIITVFVLPAILYVSDKLIRKTTLKKLN